jgi:ribosome-associated protein
MEPLIQDKSKTQVKKEAEALQRLGEELIKLPRQKLARIDIPEELRKAVKDAQNIKSHVAQRRQRQFIGTLMRGIDPEPVHNALLQIDAGHPRESKKSKQAKIWIDRLLRNGPDTIEELISTFPGFERQRLSQLIRNIKKEAKTGKPSKTLKILEQLIIKNM